MVPASGKYISNYVDISSQVLEAKNLKEEASVDQEYFLCKAWEGTGPIRWRLRWLIMYSWGRNNGLHPRLGR